MRVVRVGGGDAGGCMFGLRAVDRGRANDTLFQRIGDFLTAQGLSPEPGHYAFAYQVVFDQGGPLAQTVERLTDGGVRLTRQDIEQLGGRVSTTPTPLVAPAIEAPPPAVEGQALMARTQLQVEGFETMMRSMQDETRGFGRDLASSQAEITRSGEAIGLADIVKLTGVMLQRVRASERRLEAAMEETSELRTQLEAAQGSARRDPLTDLANRRALEEAFAAAQSGSAQLCLAVCDVDRFKLINDGFGHCVGDRVLKTIGQTLVAQCGPHLVARYGGEEFAVLFTGVSMATAHADIEMARVAMGERRLRVRESAALLGSVTFSAGLGVVTPGEPFDAAFARADRALYRAKALGRNQTVIAEEPVAAR